MYVLKHDMHNAVLYFKCFLIYFSTPAVLEYQSKLPSNRATYMTSEMRQKFREVNEEKALILHEALEAKER